MKTEFLRSTFKGARFAEHTLPLELARDLAAYETLVIELAKHLYKLENPSRQRVVKGFGTDFQLHLEKVDEGSVIPKIIAFASFAMPFNPWFEQARDLVTECVAAPIEKLPDAFPREFLTYFNQIGRSLRAGESWELSANAVLTPERRRDLVLAASKVYERQFELFGTIEEVDWKKETYRLRVASDGSTATIPMPALESDRSKVRAYGGRNRFGAVVKGVGNYTAFDKLKEVIDVAPLEIQPNYELAAKFEALSALEDGWFDGRGVAPGGDALAFVTENFLEGYPENLDLPSIVPTPEGNLLFEWNAPGSPSVDLTLDGIEAEFHAFGPNNTDIEQDFELHTDDEWASFFSFLSDNVESSAE